MITLSHIFIYPIKSIKGVSLTSAGCQEKGFEHDRRWMLIDENNRFISQRELPEMALLRLFISEKFIILHHKNMKLQSVQLPIIPENGIMLKAEVWSDIVKVIWPQYEADAWFTKVLGIECRLVYMPEESTRLVDPDFVQRPVSTSLSDGYPYLLTNRASLHFLSKKAGLPVEMERFRSNIIVEADEPFAEDRWKKIQIGEAVFEIVKPCARCAIPGIDPETGIKGKQPLSTLNRYRKQGNKVLFGQNMILEKEGPIHTGDSVIILEEK
jgi:uncharacterized protein YcbX